MHMVFTTIDIILQPFQETDLRDLCSSHKLICNMIIWFNPFLLRQQEDEPYWVWYHCLTISSLLFWKSSVGLLGRSSKIIAMGLSLGHCWWLVRDWTVKSAVRYFLEENIPSISHVSIFLLLTVLIKLSLFSVLIWDSLLTWSDQKKI